MRIGRNIGVNHLQRVGIKNILLLMHMLNRSEGWHATTYAYDGLPNILFHA